MEDIGRTITQLSETIRRIEDAPKKHEIEDEPQPKPEPESSGENALTRSPKLQRADKFRRKEK